MKKMPAYVTSILNLSIIFICISAEDPDFYDEVH